MERWVRKKLEKCIRFESDYCHMCGKAFTHGEATYTGLKGKKGFTVGGCCQYKLDEVYMGGMYFTRKPNTDDMERIKSHPHADKFVSSTEDTVTIIKSPETEH